MFGNRRRRDEPTPEPVRAAQVERLVKLMHDDNDAFDIDGEHGTTMRPKKAAVLAAAMRNSTRAEIADAAQRARWVGEW